MCAGQRERERARADLTWHPCIDVLSYTPTHIYTCERACACVCVCKCGPDLEPMYIYIYNRIHIQTCMHVCVWERESYKEGERERERE